MELTPKQTAVMQSMKRLRKPAGLLTIMTSSTGMDSKAQVKTVLQQLIELGAARLQSNNQYRALPEGLKVLDAIPAMKAVPPKRPDEKTAPAPAAHKIKAKPEAIDNRVKELQAELNTVREQLNAEQENNQSLITNLREIRTAVDAAGMAHSGLIERLKRVHSEHHEMCNQAPSADAPTQEPQRIKTRDALAHLSEQLSDILDDTARILVIAGETPEIVCNSNRYEIPTSSEKETEQFFQSLSWISGQRIDEAA